MTTKLIKILLAVSVQLFIAPSCFSQGFAFKCCNEYNFHKSTCKNFNELQVWEITLDSIVLRQEKQSIKSNFTGVALIQLNRRDSSFTLSIKSPTSSTPFLNIEHRYQFCNWITDCHGNEMPELGVTLDELGEEVLFGGFYWSKDDCNEPDFYLQYTSISYDLYGKVKVIDE